MDITIFAWIFVIIFFLVYSAIQTQRCCKSLQIQIANRRNQNTATNNNATQIYTVEGDIRQSDTTSSCRVSLSVGAVDMPLPCSRSNNNQFYLNRNGIISDRDMKKDDGLPTYEEATAIDANNNNDSNTQSTRATAAASEIASSPAQISAATSSPSVVINIETHIGNPST